MLRARLWCGSLSITTPVSLLSNEFDVRSVLHVHSEEQLSMAAFNQICAIHGAMGCCKKSKDSLKDCFEDVNITNGPRLDKTCLRGFANNTGADQPAHQRSLISASVIRFLESTIFNLATDEISIF